MQTSFYSRDELEKIGFKAVGKNVFLSRNAQIRDASKILIGNNVRIDDFCVLSGTIELEDYIHIAVYSALFGGNVGIKMESFSGLSSRCTIYAESDDYSGNHLTNPMVDEKFKDIVRGKVILEKHVILGTGTTVLPGVRIGEGSAVGSMSLVNKDLESWGIYFGIPCKWQGERSQQILFLEKEFIDMKGICE